MVIARIEHKSERLCVGDESQHLSDVIQNGENFETSQGYVSQNETPLCQGVMLDLPEMRTRTHHTVLDLPDMRTRTHHTVNLQDTLRHT